jgi:hypothetical protein
MPSEPSYLRAGSWPDGRPGSGGWLGSGPVPTRNRYAYFTRISYVTLSEGLTPPQSKAYIVCNSCALCHHDSDNALAFIRGGITECPLRLGTGSGQDRGPAKPFTSPLVTKPSKSHHRRPLGLLVLPSTSSSRPRACSHSFHHSLPRPSCLRVDLGMHKDAGM